MNLKKSDKIIAVVGVIILILAAIGLVLYVDSDSEDDGEKDKTDTDVLTYDVISEVSEAQDAVADAENPEYVIKNKIFNQGTWAGKFTVNHENLKSVSVFVEFKDNQAGLIPKLMKTLGADTLTISVLDENGEEIGSEQITGSNNVTIMKNYGSELSLESIVADDENQAREMLEGEYTPAKTLTVDVQLSLKTALFGKIREVLLKSDSFVLEVSYTYFNYDIVEQMQDGDDDDDDENKDTGSRTYSQLSLPGKH